MQTEPTDWDVVQAKIGNRAPIPTKEPGQLARYRNQEDVEEEKSFKKWESAVLEKFDELSELDDENVLLAFREKRIADLKAKALRARFGQIYEVSEPEYKDEVTNVKDTFVVVFLFKVGVPKCDILETRLRPLVSKYKSTKFVKIRGESAIRGYPDKNLPTLLVYYNGNIVGQILGLEPLGGESVTSQDVEWALHKLKALEDCELDEDPRADRSTMRVNFKLQRGRGRERVDSDDDDDADD